MPAVDLTPRLVRDSEPGARDTILFDRAAPGFGLRIHPSGRKVYIVQARIDGRSRRMVIARHSDMDLAEARRRARELLARIRAGGNPAEERRRVRRTPLFRAFAEEYLRRSEPQWKPSGRKTVRIYLKARLLPAFGAMALDRIGPADVAAWFDAASRDRPGAANRAFEILRAMMFRAEEWGWRERGSNPCLGIAKNARNRVARFLDADELERLGRVLDACSNRWPEAVAAIDRLAVMLAAIVLRQHVKRAGRGQQQGGHRDAENNCARPHWDNSADSPTSVLMNATMASLSLSGASRPNWNSNIASTASRRVAAVPS